MLTSCTSPAGSMNMSASDDMQTVSPFRTVEGLPFSQMRNLTFTIVPPVPGTSDIPTQSGIIASTVSQPDMTQDAPPANTPDGFEPPGGAGTSFQEMISGQPDAPEMQNPFTPKNLSQNLPQNPPQNLSQNLPQNPPQNLPNIPGQNITPTPLPEFLPPQNPEITPPVTPAPNPLPNPLPQPPQNPVPPPVLPSAPQFQVPANPLLPPGYQEFINYENLQYLNGFLRTQIGKYMRVEQLVGSNNIEDRYGYLVGVGINYILLQELGTGNILAVDYYGIKSVYVYFNQTLLPMGR